MSKETDKINPFIMDLSDEAWYGVNVDQDAIRQGAINSAIAGGNNYVFIFVIPDPVFPMYGKSTRHKVFERSLKQKSQLFETAALFTGIVYGEDYDKLGELDRRKLIKRVRDTLNTEARGVPGRYEIRLRHGQVEKLLERGRV